MPKVQWGRVVRSLRPKNPNNGNVVVLIATASEIEVLIEALDAKAFRENETDGAKYGNLRVDLIQARYGNRAQTRAAK